MKIVNNRFWRLEPADGEDPAAVLESAVLTSPAELISRIRRLDGIVIGAWDSGAEHGRVHALGIVQEIQGKSAVVEWRRANFTLHPSGQGATQWRKRAFFEFVPTVAARYGLMEYFQDAFATNDTETGNPTHPTDEPATSAVTVALSQYAHAEPDAAAIPKSLDPQCNRVAPDGTIFATPERGTFMGNRTSPPRWLVCDLHFKRDLKEERKYTKLFFLDEAVALSAGHRPCNTCRRERYQAYLAAVKTDIGVGGAADLDALLKTARRTAHARSPIAALPDGAFIVLGDGDYRLKWSGTFHLWTAAGYVDSATAADLQIDHATVLTPGPSLAALRNGYLPAVHTSATS